MRQGIPAIRVSCGILFREERNFYVNIGKNDGLITDDI